jgi:hypothetical protein
MHLRLGLFNALRVGGGLPPAPSAASIGVPNDIPRAGDEIRHCDRAVAEVELMIPIVGIDAAWKAFSIVGFFIYRYSLVTQRLASFTRE